MKKILFQRISSIFGMSILFFLFFACFDAPQISEQQKVKVTFTVEDNTARTVLPLVSLTDIASYKLLGGKDYAAETVLLESFIDTKTSIELDPGMWNFTLNAYNDSGENILQGKVQDKRINLTGANQVSFSLSGVKDGNGSIQITLNFPEVAGITRINTTGDAGSENFIPDSKESFFYEKNGIASGDYFINFELYRGDVLRTVVSELVLVRNGLTSSKIITLVGEDLKPLALTGTVTISPTESITIGMELTAAYNGTETVTYQWNKNGSAILNATETKYIPNSNGSYTVTVRAAGYNSISSAAVIIIGSDITVPGTTLQAKLSWLANNVESYSSYVLEVSGDETISPSTLSYSGKTDIFIELIGVGITRNISLSTNGSIFTVGNGVTLILDKNITLRGRSDNNASLVLVNYDGTLIMNGGQISNNTFYRALASYSPSNFGASGGGVNNSGTFILNSGKISGNTVSSRYQFQGDASYVSSISYGGGVSNSGTFIMNGGEISSNTASSFIASNSSGSAYSLSYGGGVSNSGTFFMKGGEISGNSLSSSYPANSISKHYSYSYGGGVYVSGGTFIKTGGIIYGTNIVNDDIVGHAVFAGSKYRESTAGTTDNMDSNVAGIAGGWEN